MRFCSSDMGSLFVKRTENVGVKIYDSFPFIKLCELLTKYEQARSLSFKIRVSKIDAEKIVKLDILTESSGVRPYTISRPNIKSSVTVRNNTGSVNKTKKYEYPQKVDRNQLSGIMNPLEQGRRQEHGRITPFRWNGSTVCIKKNDTQLYGLQKVFSLSEVGKNVHAA